MPTIRIEYYKGKSLSEKKFPVCITVTHKGVPKRKSVDSCTVEEWDSKNKLIKALNRRDTASVIKRNDAIDDELTKYKAKFKELKDSGKDWNSEDVFKNDIEVTVIKKELTFWDIADKYLYYIKSEKSPASYIDFKAKVDKFKNFINNDDFKLSDFTEDLISKYKVHLRQLNNKDSTMNSAFKVLRFVSKYASAKKLGESPKSLHEFTLPQRKSGHKRKLDSDEIDAFENADAMAESKVEEAQDMFLISYLFRGMRISDVFKMKQSFIQGTRLVYISQKNEKVFDIKMPSKAIEILKKYLDGREYVFTFYQWEPDPNKNEQDNRVDEYLYIKRLTSHVNNRLKKLAKRAGITKNLSTHIARHSFAKKALSVIKDTNITMDLLGHSDLSIHQAYIRELSKSDDLDDAMDKIFD